MQSEFRISFLAPTNRDLSCKFNVVEVIVRDPEDLRDRLELIIKTLKGMPQGHQAADYGKDQPHIKGNYVNTRTNHGHRTA